MTTGTVGANFAKRTYDTVRVSASRFNPLSALFRKVLVPWCPSFRRIGDTLSCQTVLGSRVECRDLRLGDAGVVNGKCIIAPRRPLIIGFHGNGGASDNFEPFWDQLEAFGDVVAVNQPGYGATPAPRNGAKIELHMAAGVQAIADHAVKEWGYSPQDITWYGSSLGGTQAAIGFQMLPGSNLILHDSLTTVPEVAATVLERQGFWRPLARLLARFLAWIALPRGLTAKGLRYTSDGLDTLEKLHKCSTTHRAAGSRVLVLGVEKDQIMGDTFAETLHSAYYGESKHALPFSRWLHVAALPNGGHCGLIDERALFSLTDFMCRKRVKDGR